MAAGLGGTETSVNKHGAEVMAQWSRQCSALVENQVQAPESMSDGRQAL